MKYPFYSLNSATLNSSLLRGSGMFNIDFNLIVADNFFAFWFVADNRKGCPYGLLVYFNVILIKKRAFSGSLLMCSFLIVHQLFDFFF